MVSKIDRYKEILTALQKHLSEYSDTKWPHRLEKWLLELKGADKKMMEAHFERTLKSLGGMGSIGDVVICPENGHSISNDEKEIENVNNKLKDLVSSLDKATEDLLKECGK